MKTNHYWTEKENNLLSEYQNLRNEDIAKVFKENGFDRTTTQISSRRYKLGLVSYEKNENDNTMYLRNNRNTILEDLANGLSIATISKRLKIHRDILEKYLKKEAPSKNEIPTFDNYFSKQELNIVQCEMAKNPLSIQKILSDYGIARTLEEISQMKSYLSVKNVSEKDNFLQILKENESDILKMLNIGKNITFIAYELGVNRELVKEYMTKTMGIDLLQFANIRSNKFKKKQNQLEEQENPLPVVYGYIRVSSDVQTHENQRFELAPYAQSKGYVISEWFEEIISGAKDISVRKLGILVDKLKKGDVLFIAELSRLSRKLMDIMSILKVLMNKGIILFCKKENMQLGDNMISNILAFAFGLSAQIERELTIQRTKEGIERRKSMGMKMGRSQKLKSATNIISSACVEHDEKIQELLGQKISIKEIAKIINVSSHTLMIYLENKRKGLHIISPQERKQAIDKKRQEIGKESLKEYLPEFVLGDLNYLKNNKDKFITFKNLGFSYDNLSIILQIDKASLQSLTM